MKHALVILVVGFVLSGCATTSIVPLSENGQRIREISNEESKSCTFIKTVFYVDSYFWKVGKTPSIMRALGESNLRNVVGESGGDSFVITQDDHNFFMGTVNYKADAFVCRKGK